ncbi:MAG TPA: hypothetical protein VLB44_17085 [Kofleriaceae bacterium]|nr:hypothetical protein [Kofleriaceae bacterium]
MKRLLVAMVVVFSAGGIARADSTWHIGVDARTDLGTHPGRLALGMRHCVWDGTLVVDPMAVFDGEHDGDALADWYFDDRIALMFGWRWSVISVADGYLQQQRSLVGVTGVGPSFFDRRLRTSLSLELETLWVKYGADTKTEWIALDRNFLDHVGLGLFVRIDYAR